MNAHLEAAPRFSEIGLRPQLQPPNEATPLQLALRHKWSILIFAVAVTALGAAVVGNLPKRYLSTASIVVDSRQLRVTTAENFLSTQTLDTDQLRTQMEALRSPVVARQVVERLGLQRLTEFCTAAQPPRPIPERLVILGRRIAADAATTTGLPNPFDPPAAPALPCPVSVDAAAKHLLQNVITAANDGRSYVIRLSAMARDPRLAAAIANAYAEAFVDLRQQDRRRVAEQALATLRSHLNDLRAEMQAASAALEQHRIEHSLISMRGETLFAQSLSQLNAELSAATGELTRRETALQQLRTLLRTSGSAEASATALGSPIIQRLQERMAEPVALLARLSAQLGRSHPDVQAANAQVERLREQIRVEVTKTVTALVGEVEALSARKAALAERVVDARQRLGEEARAEVRQRELERNVTLSNSLYDTMLTRLRQIGTEQGLQHADAYVAVEARAAEEPAAPRTRMILVGIFFTALGIGTAAGAGLSLRSRAFRAPGEVEERTGLLVLGAFAKPRRGRSPQRIVLDAPASPEAEELHRIVAGLTRRFRDHDHDQPLGRIVLVTSSLPGEGKTSFSVALGHSAARAGLSTIVVDGDLRRAGLCEVPLAAPPTRAREEPPAAATDDTPYGMEMADPHSSMRVLPLHGPVANPHEFLSSAKMPKLLAGLRQRHDLVIIDTPPVLSVADPLTLARFADEVVLVVDWTRTNRGLLEDTLRAFDRAGIAVGGAVLSKLDLRCYGRPAASYYAPLTRRLNPELLQGSRGA